MTSRTHELHLPLSELTGLFDGARCVVCQAGSAGPHPVARASGAGFRLPPDFGRELPLCRACGEAQRRTERRARTLRACAAVAPIGFALALVAVVAPAPTVALSIFVAGTLASVGLVLWSQTRLGAVAPALVLGGDRRAIVLQIAPPAPAAVAEGAAYRRPVEPEAPASRAARPRAMAGGAVVLAASLALGAVGYGLVYERAYPEVGFHNTGNRVARVTLPDGRGLSVPPGGRRMLRVPHRAAALEVTVDDRRQTLPLELPLGGSAVVSVVLETCFVDERGVVRRGRVLASDRPGRQDDRHAFCDALARTATD